MSGRSGRDRSEEWEERKRRDAPFGKRITVYVPVIMSTRVVCNYITLTLSYFNILGVGLFAVVPGVMWEGWYQFFLCA